jgi:Flp pilus assembly protein TadD
MTNFLGPTGLEGWTELIRISPTDPMLRARFAADLIRRGQFESAERELTTCLELAPVQSRPRLLIVVLRARAKMAARRAALVNEDFLL